ncbi:hypothetical protein COR50_19535 [Chitinophaga caeni]|uniref:Uncharacterized protein n=1 Tax=Chitinophaga caeni TaxID=2029983 RepID=A0A291QZ05_9BACT|nr:DNRLRE domain-containing protein [Chitinophaga caeni]ATL49190.1 hypothetical protein COR50_19535 [Chitinophaga caeni]
MKTMLPTWKQAVFLAASSLCFLNQLKAQSPFTDTLVAIEDTYVNSNSADDQRNANYGSSTQLRFRYSQTSSGSNYNLVTYLKFDLKQLGLPAYAVIDSASLLGTIYYSQSGSGHVWNLLPVATNSWGEYTATWNNKPGFGPDTISAVTKPTVAISETTPYQATWGGLKDNVSAALSGDSLLSLALYTRLNTGANTSMYSREWTDTSMQPRLVLHYRIDSSYTPPAPREVESRTNNLNIVYFLPTDVDTVANYRQRLNGIMLQAQDFYRKWMTYWGYTDETFGLNKDSSGMLKITIINGTYDKTYYPYDGGGSKIIPEVNAYFSAHPGEKTSTHTLVILPESGYNPFYGLGNGWCFALDNPNIDTSYFSTGGTSSYIGGLVHELGHGLNLPHDKEYVSQKSNPAMGTNLMGSGNSTYGKSATFMTEASCAILHNCEVFRTQDTIPDMYGGGTGSFTTFHSSYSGGYIHLSGTFTTNKDINGIVVYNDQDDDGANYDQLAWMANLVGTDSFNVAMPVAEFWKKYSTYTLRLKFLFTNGSSKDVVYPYYFEDEIPVLDINFEPMDRPEGIEPSADTYIRNGGSANTNFGTDSTMTIKPDPNSGYKREAFLKFNLNDFSGDLANIDSLHLYMKVKSANSSSNKTKLIVKWTTKSDWDESASPLTWNSWVADSSHVDSIAGNFYYGGDWVHWSLNKDTLLNAIRAGDTTVVFHIYGEYSGSSTSTSDLTFYSKNATDASDRPSLVIVESPSMLARKATNSLVSSPVNKLPELMEVYPNPVRDEVHIRSHVAGSAVLYNVHGSPVKQLNLVNGNDNILDVSGLPSGPYYLVYLKGTSAPAKIIVVR